MRRVTDVMDCWFESGSMSFAQVHYPFENTDWFEHHFPGDFIVEYIGQTRGWFYTMHVLASAIFERPAFETCLSHGIVLGSDGQKMSKSLRNYPDVREVFDRDGADAMRWFLMSSPILRGGNLIVTERNIREGVRQVLIPLWNCWYFFALYANAAGYTAQRRTDSADPLDRYLLAKTHQYVADMTRQLDDYEIANACDSTRSFLDVLSNWYIRRSRERFWAADGNVDEAAFDTLYTVLETVARCAAPLLPLTTEEIWRGLTGERSVHLTDYPSADDAAGRRRAGHRDGPGPRGVLGRLGAAQGRRAPQPAAAGRADHRGQRRRRAGRVRADRGRRAQREVRPPARRPSTPTPRRTASPGG